MKEIVKSILFVIPILAVMGICCIFNGDVNTANVIWDSYQPYFVNVYGESLPMSEAVNALNWDLSFAMKHHLRMNYLIFPRMFGWLITFFATFYLCANTNRINLFSYESKEVNSISLTSILIFQFISLLPLFTVLSCDLGRITIYWTITSFFIYSLFENAINIHQFTNVSLRINEIFNSRLLSNRYFYIFIVVVVFCPLVWFVIPDAYNSTIIGNIHRFIELVYKLL